MVVRRVIAKSVRNVPRVETPSGLTMQFADNWTHGLTCRCTTRGRVCTWMMIGQNKDFPRAYTTDSTPWGRVCEWGVCGGFPFMRACVVLM